MVLVSTTSEASQASISSHQTPLRTKRQPLRTEDVLLVLAMLSLRLMQIQDREDSPHLGLKDLEDDNREEGVEDCS